MLPSVEALGKPFNEEIKLTYQSAQSLALSLGACKSAGSGYLARCPSHDDKVASLSISERPGGGVLVHCHAGCSQESVIDSLRDLQLWDSKSTMYSAPIVVATYEYRDAEGLLIYRKVRTDPKGFYQERPDGSGGWIRNLQGVHPVLYRLPELLSAIDDGKTVYIVEGEKDVETLRMLGLIGTTNSGGAGKWKSELSGDLQNAREVIVIPDNDESGRKHAQRVADSLKKQGTPVKIVVLPDLPDKGDLSDWISKGGSKASLLELCANADYFADPDLRKEVTHCESSEADWSDSESFGEPLLFGERETPEITSEFLPPWIKEFVDALADSTQTPPAMAAMLALPVMATCLQKKYEVSPYADDYSEPLSLWTLVALPPASRKTAVLEALCAPLSEWETDEAIRLAPEIDRARLEIEVTERRIEELTRQASKSED